VGYNGSPDLGRGNAGRVGQVWQSLTPSLPGRKCADPVPALLLGLCRVRQGAESGTWQRDQQAVLPPALARDALRVRGQTVRSLRDRRWSPPSFVTKRRLRPAQTAAILMLGVEPLDQCDATPHSRRFTSQTLGPVLVAPPLTLLVAFDGQSSSG
jgi:hypothetical protein